MSNPTKRAPWNIDGMAGLNVNDSENFMSTALFARHTIWNRTGRPTNAKACQGHRLGDGVDFFIDYAETFPVPHALHMH